MSSNALLRAGLIGAATGARSATGLAAFTLCAPADARGRPEHALGTTTAKVTTSLAALGELVADKLPVTPSRTTPGPLIGRLVIAAGLGVLVLRRGQVEDTPAAPAATAAGLAAAAATGELLLGVRWRAWAADRFGTDLVGALVEDGFAVAASWLAVRD
ncbi:MAG: hypothetical protein ACR2LI_07300 [Propionibacteriaceae bacterium]